MHILFSLVVSFLFAHWLVANFVKKNNVVPGVKSKLIHHTAAPVNGTDEVWTITGGATSGTFKVSHGGYQTAALAFNATATVIRDAVRALPHVGSGGVTSSGGPLNTTPVVLTMAGRLGRKNVGVATIINVSLAGGTVTIARTTPGVDATQRNAPLGAMLIDDATGNVYVNGGTNPAQSWGKVGTQT